MASEAAFGSFWEAFAPPGAWKMSVSCTRDAVFEKRACFEGVWVWEWFLRAFGRVLGTLGAGSGGKKGRKKDPKKE